MNTELLGNMGEYMVFVTGPTPESGISSNLNWSELSWGRTLATPSEASVTCPLTDLVDHNGVIAKDWSHGLSIWRNGERVWWGPIRRISSTPGSLSVSVDAVDAMGLTAKRELHNDRELNDVDISAAFAFLVGQAGDLRGLSVPQFDGGVRVGRSYQVSDYTSIEQHLNDFNRLVQWTVVDHELIVVTDRTRRVFGTFTDAAFRERPGFTLDGEERANEVVIPGGMNGEAGFARAWRASTLPGPEGRLTRFENADFFRPTEGLDFNWDAFFGARASQMVEEWSALPMVIEGAPLTPEAPVHINNLIPGTVWQLSILQDSLPWLSVQQILESVEVRVSTSDGISETVSPTLIPPTELNLPI